MTSDRLVPLPQLWCGGTLLRLRKKSVHNVDEAYDALNDLDFSATDILAAAYHLRKTELHDKLAKMYTNYTSVLVAYRGYVVGVLRRRCDSPTTGTSCVPRVASLGRSHVRSKLPVCPHHGRFSG